MRKREAKNIRGETGLVGDTYPPQKDRECGSRHMGVLTDLFFWGAAAVIFVAAINKDQ